MKKNSCIAMVMAMFFVAGTGCTDTQASKTPIPEENPSDENPSDDTQDVPKVYLFSEITERFTSSNASTPVTVCTRWIMPERSGWEVKNMNWLN